MSRADHGYIFTWARDDGAVPQHATSEWEFPRQTVIAKQAIVRPFLHLKTCNHCGLGRAGAVRTI